MAVIAAHQAAEAAARTSSPAQMAYADTTTQPVLDRARELLDFYGSDASDQGPDETLALTHFSIRPATADENPTPANSPDYEPCFVIACESVVLEGPLGKATGQHDDVEIITDSGRLVSHRSDGVEQVVS